MSKYLTDEWGNAAAEYMLIMAIIGSAIVAAMTAYGGQLSTALSYAGSAMIAPF